MCGSSCHLLAFINFTYQESRANIYKMKKAGGRKVKKEWHLQNDFNKRLEESVNSQKGIGMVVVAVSKINENSCEIFQ